MATTKQANLIVNLAVRAGKIRPDQIAEATCQALDYTHEQARVAIDKLNAELGFDRGHSPATTRQRSYILDMEQRVLGRWETTHTTKVSYSDADERIRYLKKLEAAQKARPAVSAPVIDLFTKKAV